MKYSVLTCAIQPSKLNGVKRFYLLIYCLSISAYVFSQSDYPNTDTFRRVTIPLQEVVVKAYEQNRKLIEVPASIGLLDEAQLNRFGNGSILYAINTIPGIRMEERSPASYRLNFRGSSLRSPFGVRDVKVYYNEIPLSDPNGNTYLNGLSFYNFQSLEAIKGPAGSLYGAAIGGALLIRTLPSVWEPGVNLDYTTGSFAMNNIHTNVLWGDSSHHNDFDFNHISSNGYRIQTQSRRDIATWETQLKATEKQVIHAYIYYSDLFYQTPGGLTQTQFDQDPRQARPAAGTSPSAVQAQAAIYQKTFVAGFSNEYYLSPLWQNTTSVYGSYTDFRNPGIRVYEIRKEPHFGGRTVFQYKRKIHSAELQVNFGAEGQKGFFTTADYANNQGSAGLLQTNENINNWQYMAFAQADLKFGNGWIITAGASFNKSSIEYASLSPLPPLDQTRIFENKIAPRLAVLKRITPTISLFASAAKGFSPPTVSELLTSSGVIGYNLQPEDGIDYEGGIRGNLFQDKLYFDVDAFFFHIKNAIVQRIDTNNVYYYVNAGSTRQNGIESYLSYQLIDHPQQAISHLKLWASYTWYDFHYHSFIDVNSQSSTVINYSGNQLPGVPTQTLVAGLDISTSMGFYANLTYTYTDHTPLNDANTAYAGSYNLLGARAGYRTIFNRRLKLEIFGGVDNVFNTTYSLGDDFNAAAGKYFNAAAGINYYVGLSLGNLFR
jgi:iron complex outermembrane receptor protein